MAEIENVIDAVIERTLAYCDASPEWEVSVSIVSGEEIRGLNKRYRGIDAETDVLSFPQFDFVPGEKIVYAETEPCLGDIVICMDKAVSQAEAYGHSLEREIGFLTAHSMLHLFGYDHMNEAEEREMFRRQEEILRGLGLSREGGAQ